MARRKKKHSQEDVELNVTAMLDMAFQLLSFFILTFSPPPIESQFSLRLPPPKPIESTDPKAKKAGSDTNDKDPIKGVKTLTISAFADKEGRLGAMGIGEEGVGKLPELDEKLRKIFSDPASPFEQVIVQVAPELHYEDLMKVVEVCAKQTKADGTKLTKLSFVDAGPSQ